MVNLLLAGHFCCGIHFSLWRTELMDTDDSYPRWDPSRIFPNSQSVDIEDIFRTVTERAALLSRETRQRVAGLGSAELLDAIRRYESCVRDLQLVTSYAELRYGLHDQGTPSVSLLNRCDIAWAELAAELGFFEEELAAR